MDIDHYYYRPINSTFHDLTTYIKPRPYLRSILGLGLKYIPTPRSSNNFKKMDAFTKIRHALKLGFWFAGKPNDPTEYNPRIYVRSKWDPPAFSYPKVQLDPRLDRFESTLKSQFKPRQGTPNLLPHQQRALNYLQSQKDLLVVPCDKNLGPAVIERDRYISIIFEDHLNDVNNYKVLTPQRATQWVNTTKVRIDNWIARHKKTLGKSDFKSLKAHLEQNRKPFGRFYGTLKVHKMTPDKPLTSRPIVSTPGSLLYPLAAWVDTQLQIVARAQPTYLRNSYSLKQTLMNMDLLHPQRCRLFTADAVSMYTNIPTTQALNSLGAHLEANRDVYDIPVAATMEAIRLVMRENVFTFGDMIFKQMNGTAMGTPPACAIATIFFAINGENDVIQDFSNNLLFLKRFIDDLFGIWRCHPDPATDAILFQQFIDQLNQCPGLTWIVSPLTNQVDFLDLTITLKDGRFTTTLYEKDLNLYLYIPPKSAHPPGLLPGVVFGTLFRIQTLCSDEQDRSKRSKEFFKRLVARGYQPHKIQPLFDKAIERARNYTGPTVTADDTRRKAVFFHVQYHPKDPASHLIQKAWKECVAAPPFSMKLEDIRNPRTKLPLGFNRMIIAYSRPMNLGNMLTHRNLPPEHNGRQVSSYYEPTGYTI